MAAAVIIPWLLIDHILFLEYRSSQKTPITFVYGGFHEVFTTSAQAEISVGIVEINCRIF